MLLRGLLRHSLYITQKTLGITGKSKQEMSRREVTSKGCTSEKLSKQVEVKECSLGTLIKPGLSSVFWEPFTQGKPRGELTAIHQGLSFKPKNSG